MVFTGHSLGSGVAALLTDIDVNHGGSLGGVPRSMIRCYAMAHARCMSLNLAVKYADVINSVVLQDDFLPRTATPLEDIFKSIFRFFERDVTQGVPLEIFSVKEEKRKQRERMKPGGIIALLDEACMFPRSTHETFAQNLYQTFKNHNRFSKPKLSRSDFTIGHYAGDVTYQTDLFLDKNKDYVVAEHQSLLNASSCSFV